MAAPSQLTVDQVLEQKEMAGARVMAGGRGLCRPVRFLNVMTVPEIIQWTKQDELLLTTGYPLPRDPAAQCDLLRELDSRGVAALVIKFNAHLPGLAQEVLDVADNLEIPLVEIPPSLPIDEILSAVCTRLRGRRTTVSSRFHALHDTVLEAVASGGGLSAIADSLSAFLQGAAIAVVDTLGRVRAAAGEVSHLPHAWRRGWSDTAPLIGAEGVSALAPIRAGTIDHGWIVAAMSGGDTPATVQEAIDHGAVIAGIEMTRDLAVLTVERQFAYETLRELVTATDRLPHDAISRAARFGWDLDRPVVVLTTDLRMASRLAPGSARRGEPADGRKVPAARALELWTSVVRAHDSQAACAGSGVKFIAVLGASAQCEHVAQRIYDEIAERCGWGLVIGISKATEGTPLLGRAYKEATTAASVGKNLLLDGPAISYAKLGIYRLLNHIDKEERYEFVADVLGPVLRLPSAAREELLTTLEVLLEERLNVAEASRRLHYHYNTLRYRIGKLEALLGDFTTTAESRLQIELAVQIERMRNVKSASRRAGGRTAPREWGVGELQNLRAVSQ